MNQSRQGFDSSFPITACVMQQNGLAASLGVIIQGLVHRSLYDFIRSNPRLPIAGINAQADHNVIELLGPQCRFDFLRFVGFRISEIWGPKQHGGSSGDRFNQTLGRV